MTPEIDDDRPVEQAPAPTRSRSHPAAAVTIEQLAALGVEPALVIIRARDQIIRTARSVARDDEPERLVALSTARRRRHGISARRRRGSGVRPLWDPRHEYQQAERSTARSPTTSRTG